MSKIDDSELQKIITGRVEPYIYSFETNTLPNLLKIGDTYRPVEERLKEWRKYYANLREVSRHSALVTNDIYFRDHAVHRYLEEIGVQRESYSKDRGIFSNEFFRGITKQHIDDAIQDVQKNYKKSAKYDYYDSLKELQETHYSRNNAYQPRPNQKEVIDNFSKARKSGRTNLLMYAVMRFGKSITSMWCAKEMNAKITVVVSAKADVKQEWQRTIESNKDFKGYRFVDSITLDRHPDISSILNHEFELGDGKREICSNVVLFFTLQDLAGSTNSIKKRHEILHDNKIDLLIIDETHFGARAPLLGKILSGNEITQEDKKTLEYVNTEDDVEDFGQIKKLQSINATIKLHLSGTPYRILMGSEFQPEDIIAFVQFVDIYKAKIAWNQRNISKDEAEDEWKNPYFGFPQMIRFAFNPNESSRRLLENIAGSSPADIFAPIATKKSASGDFQLFKHEREVTELLQVLDGTRQDGNMLGLLDNPSVANGKLARHIVFALPYRASCDALEKLIKENTNKFKNLSEYKIINAAGHNIKSAHDTPSKIKNAIESAESSDKKTITLTVNKMLTGVTVPQWDTMIYLKATMSPQDYDQAIFRLQSPWIKGYYDNTGGEIKLDMKPQTLLVDLYPVRMFQMQEQKALVYGINTGQTGNQVIKENIRQDLEVSPIIRINVESDKLEEVTPANIMDAVRRYESTRAIVDEVREISIDTSLRNIDQLAAIIDTYPELGSKAGIIREKPTVGEGGVLSPGDGMPTDGGEIDKKPPTPAHNGDAANSTVINTDLKRFENKLRTLYLLILLFSFLSDTKEESFKDVISSLNATANNKRIAENLRLNKQELEQIRKWINGSIESQLDYKIQNADIHADDASILPFERIDLAIHKFGKISDSEIFTPKDIVTKIYDTFNEGFWQSTPNNRVLDIASKSGSFANGYVRQAATHGLDVANITNNFYSIPTSGAAYEFTRKTYETLGLNIDNIAKNFTAFDLITLTKDEVRYLLEQDKKFCDITLDDLKMYNKEQHESEKSVKFAAIVGNPPYQESDNDSGKGSAKPLYHLFIERCITLEPRFISLITPSVWFTGGKGLSKFRNSMLNDARIREFNIFNTPKDIFPDANLRGGVNFFLWDSQYNNHATGNIKVVQYEKGKQISNGIRPYKIDGLENIFISDNRAVNLLEKLFRQGAVANDLENETMLAHQISSRNPFGFDTKFRKTTAFYKNKNEVTEPIKIYVKNNITGYVERKTIQKNEQWIDAWKVATPFANNIGTDLNDDNLNTIILKPGSIVTETYLVIGADLDLNSNSALNLSRYLKTQFVRSLIALAKANHNGTRQTYRLVPMQDFTPNSDINWTGSVSSIDQQLFDKYSLSQAERDFINAKVKPLE